jgi:hypothetical protein
MSIAHAWCACRYWPNFALELTENNASNKIFFLFPSIRLVACKTLDWDRWNQCQSASPVGCRTRTVQATRGMWSWTCRSTTLCCSHRCSFCLGRSAQLVTSKQSRNATISPERKRMLLMLRVMRVDLMANSHFFVWFWFFVRQAPHERAAR